MSLYQSIHNNILDNPIQRRESTTLKRQRGKWSWRIMYALTAFIMIIPILWGFSRDFSDSVGVTIGLLVFANIVVFLTAVFRAVINTSSSMYRERQGKTWELLMLTGVSNWRVVMGKWNGAMRHLLRDYVWLYIIRLGTLFWVSVHYHLWQDFTWRELASSNATVTVLDSRIGGGYFLMAVVLLLLFTILELMMSSSIGLAVAFFKFKSKTSSAIGMAVRVGLAVLIPVVTFLFLANVDGDHRFLVIDDDYYNDDMQVLTFRTTTILADNGAIGVIAYADENITNEDSFALIETGHYAGIAMYLIITVIALSVAANRAFVRGLDFAKDAPAKVKRKRPLQAESIAGGNSNMPKNKHILSVASHSENVFNIEDADRYSVDIYHYQRRLGRMILRITGDDMPQYVQLSNVAYMEAPAFWKGANFRTASETEYRQFVEDKGIYINGLTEDSMYLYILEGDASVQILAGTAQILDELPHNV